MVDSDTVKYVANLARIGISDEEVEYLIPQLSRIISYIDKLKELDIAGIEPTRGATGEENVLREDVVIESKFARKILANSPLCEDTYFKIPRVIE